MNAAAIHLALNNFPPIINFAALIVIAIGLIRRTPRVTQTGLLLLVIASLFAIPVFFTGEKAERIVKHLDGVNAVAIHPHEEAADWAFTLLCIQGVAALAALFLYRFRWIVIVAILIAAFATAAVFRTAKLGGHIHHPETELPG